MKREETRGAHTKPRALGTRQAGPSQIAASLCGPDVPQCGLRLGLTLPLAGKTPTQMRSGEQPGRRRQQHPWNGGLASAPAQGKWPLTGAGDLPQHPGLWGARSHFLLRDRHCRPPRWRLLYGPFVPEVPRAQVSTWGDALRLGNRTLTSLSASGPSVPTQLPPKLNMYVPQQRPSSQAARTFPE